MSLPTTSSSSTSSTAAALSSQDTVSCLPRPPDDGILPSALQPCNYRLVPHCAHVMEYSHTTAPPSDWCVSRHRDLPCLFRDTLLSTWWTSNQQRAIAATFTAWDSDAAGPMPPWLRGQWDAEWKAPTGSGVLLMLLQSYDAQAG